MPKVSVIVPNYNHARFLRQRIDTILAQTFQDFELILLDDYSTDDSRSIFSHYANDPHVLAVEFNEKNSGSTFKQWNKGVRHARGEYIWLAESDDYSDPRFLERLVPILDASPEVAFVSCRSWQIDGDGSVTGYADAGVVHWGRYKNGAEADGLEECQNYFVHVTVVCNASSVLLRRATYEKVGGADETLRFCGDWKLWASMALTGRVVYFSEPLNYYRVHGNTMTAKSGNYALAQTERLRVTRWMLGKVTPSPSAVLAMRRDLRPVWNPAVAAWRLPLGRRLAILRDAIAIDHRVAWQVFPAGFAAIGRKFSKPWRHDSQDGSGRVSMASHAGKGFARLVRELWAVRARKRRKSPGVAWLTRSIAALSALESRAVLAEADAEAPIFLFSTGTRTGSTLLQRILVTDSRLLLWGEPMGEMNIAAGISEMVSKCLSAPFLNSWQHQPDLASADLTKSWIAHLHPPGGDFRLALRSFFDRWLGEAAQQHGFARWGFKEVRLDAAAAVFLHWLYPHAKFILITRHPLDCYRSFADAGWPGHFVRHPDVVVDSAASFAREWNRIAVSWSELPADFPSVVVKYEELISGKFDFRRLETWLGLQLKEGDALSAVVGHTAGPLSLRTYERWIVSREAASGMRLLGYSTAGSRRSSAARDSVAPNRSLPEPADAPR